METGETLSVKLILGMAGAVELAAMYAGNPKAVGLTPLLFTEFT
jgi:hypothetical protein